MTMDVQDNCIDKHCAYFYFQGKNIPMGDNKTFSLGQQTGRQNRVQLEASKNHNLLRASSGLLNTSIQKFRMGK
jgi:hypothetical protein